MAVAGAPAAGVVRRPVAVTVGLLALLLALMLSVPLMLTIMIAGSPDQSVDAGGPVQDIPAEALALYRAAGKQYGLDWAVLAAIGKIETDHCQSTMPGVHSGANSAGAQGCMQFLGSTWAAYGDGGSPYDLHDAIYAAARYLRAAGAPHDYRAAVFAYNHAGWYVDQVLAQAQEYRQAAAVAGPVGGAVKGSPRDIIDNVVLPIARANGIYRTPAMNDAANAVHGPTNSGSRSDHEGPPNVAWAADMSNGIETPEEDRLATALARRFGIPPINLSVHDSPANIHSITRGGYRFQLIYRSYVGGDHTNHVHFGVRKVT